MKIDFNKVLTTGASGMVGYYVDFGMRPARASLEITNFDEVQRFVKDCRPEAIIHLAAVSDADICERDLERTYYINTVGTYNVAAAAKSLGIKLVYISSAGIFNGVKKDFYTEEDEPNPPNHYGRSKYLGELIIKGMLENYIIIRASWIFGGGPQRDNKIVAKVIKQFSNPEIKGVTDRIGSPTYGKDFIEAIKQLMGNNEIGVFNIANKGACSVYEFIREIVSILKPNVKVTPVDSSAFNLDAARGGNISLISKINMRTWQDALKDYLETEWRPFLK